MSKFRKWFSSIYIHLILACVYIPLFFVVVYSFNKPTDKGFISTTWNGKTFEHWSTFFEEGRLNALVNSLIIAGSVSVIVITISLITVFGMWRQRNKKLNQAIMSINNIPLINPDNITAIGLVLVFGILFGVLGSYSEGIWRGIVGQTIMALPYGITIMLPRSEKFNGNQFEAAQDLGYGKVRSWFKTYFIYMLPSIIFAGLVAAFLSFDDFIILRTVSNTSTLGTKLYEGQFKGWGLVVGAGILVFVLIGNIAYITFKSITAKKIKNKKIIQDQNQVITLFEEKNVNKSTIRGGNE